MDDIKLIDLAYRTVLGRPPDPTALASWEERLKHEPKTRLFQSLISSDEFRRHYIFTQLQKSQKEKLAALSNNMAFAVVPAPLHKLRCEMVRTMLPTAVDVLDLGGASGSQQGALLDMGYSGAKNITIVDLPADVRFKAALENSAKSQHGSTQVQYAYHSMHDLDRYPDESFDLIWSGQTIEHITRAQGDDVFAQVPRLLKPGGCFALDTPNRTATRLAVGDTGFIHAEHKYEYKFEEFSEILAASGLDCIEQHGLIDVSRSLSVGYLLPDEVLEGGINNTPGTSFVFFVKYVKPKRRSTSARPRLS